MKKYILIKEENKSKEEEGKIELEDKEKDKKDEGNPATGES